LQSWKAAGEARSLHHRDQEAGRPSPLGHAIQTSVEERVYMGLMEYSVKELSEALEKIKLPCL
jgi:hypothetical protein